MADERRGDEIDISSRYTVRDNVRRTPLSCSRTIVAIVADGVDPTIDCGRAFPAATVVYGRPDVVGLENNAIGRVRVQRNKKKNKRYGRSHPGDTHVTENVDIYSNGARTPSVRRAVSCTAARPRLVSDRTHTRYRTLSVLWLRTGGVRTIIPKRTRIFSPPSPRYRPKLSGPSRHRGGQLFFVRRSRRQFQSIRLIPPQHGIKKRLYGPGRVINNIASLSRPNDFTRRG